MSNVTDIFKISSKNINSANNWEAQDLKAVSPISVGADNPGSINQEPLKWIKEESDGLIRIQSADYTGHYLGAVKDNKTCKAVLGKEFKNTWFDIVKDGTTDEYYISILKESLTCYDSNGAKYLTMGEAVKGETPITFEEEKPKPKRASQKWKFTKVSANIIPKSE